MFTDDRSIKGGGGSFYKLSLLHNKRAIRGLPDEDRLETIVETIGGLVLQNPTQCARHPLWMVVATLSSIPAETRLAKFQQGWRNVETKT